MIDQLVLGSKLIPDGTSSGQFISHIYYSRI